MAELSPTVADLDGHKNLFRALSSVAMLASRFALEILTAKMQIQDGQDQGAWPAEQGSGGAAPVQELETLKDECRLMKEFDRQIKEESKNPAKQLNEKKQSLQPMDAGKKTMDETDQKIERVKKLATGRCILFFLFLGAIAVIVVKVVDPKKKNICGLPGLSPLANTSQILFNRRIWEFLFLLSESLWQSKGAGVIVLLVLLSQAEGHFVSLDNSFSCKTCPQVTQALAAIRDFVAAASAGERLLFYFCGHGTQFPDRNLDELDGNDEALCFNDGYLVDDILHNVMVQYLHEGVHLTAIFDSCHSGTVLDLPYGNTGSGWFNASSQTPPEILQAGVFFRTSVVSISACLDSELSYFDEVNQRGWFTSNMTHYIQEEHLISSFSEQDLFGNASNAACKEHVIDGDKIRDKKILTSRRRARKLLVSPDSARTQESTEFVPVASLRDPEDCGRSSQSSALLTQARQGPLHRKFLVLKYFTQLISGTWLPKIAHMSHEIRTPMNAVIGMDAETDITDEQREYASTTRSSGEVLLGIINVILDYSKIEAGNMELDLQPTEILQRPFARGVGSNPPNPGQLLLAAYSHLTLILQIFRPEDKFWGLFPSALQAIVTRRIEDALEQAAERLQIPNKSTLVAKIAELVAARNEDCHRGNCDQMARRPLSWLVSICACSSKEALWQLLF
ncbi:hypothetical protein SELMODRAFT_430194 [Selaginella moellendorffii]|uniref:Signal transduction histidine kinase dimerisation/phosphoacceptor domain-containing protein n=1 Tax=Selaginella moellendorffii TaxID=88036 RepID=D8T8N0_SELML|nr:hypothetical protein SELMODRAFT_430194 [Selaginella moellendorffii]